MNKIEKCYIFEVKPGYCIHNFDINKFIGFVFLVILIAYPTAFFYRTPKTIEENKFVDFLFIAFAYWLICNLFILVNKPIQRVIIDPINKKITILYLTLTLKKKKLDMTTCELSYTKHTNMTTQGLKVNKLILFKNSIKCCVISTDDFDEFDINKIEKILNELGVQKLTT